jgi:dCMP deaminase
MDCARALSKLSRAQRTKVGAVIVLPDGLMLPGFNGTPSGFDNCCENERISCVHEWVEDRVTRLLYCNYCNAELPCGITSGPPLHSVELVTKPEVLHAESNAIAKAAGSTVSVRGGTLYVTSSPCLDCAKLIIQSGIVRVIYDEEYRVLSGIELLLRANIQVGKIGEG